MFCYRVYPLVTSLKKESAMKLAEVPLHVLKNFHQHAEPKGGMPISLA
jgi:hypothetical protein